MGCGCGGGNRYTNSRNGRVARGGHATAQEWIVTFPDETTETFYSDTEAYRQLRLRGGGIRQQDRTSA